FTFFHMLQRTLPAGFIAPCLPTKTDKLPSGGQWLHEIKHDGFRIAMTAFAQELAAGVNEQKAPHLSAPHRGDKVMMPADLKRLHKYMVEVEHIEVISDEMRAVVEREWPELAHKLPTEEASTLD